MTTVLRRSRPRHRAANAFVIVFCVVWAFPIYWMLSTSFKTPGNIVSTTPQFFPQPLTLDNYIGAIQKPGFLTSLGNSVLVTIVVTVVTVLLGFFAAAALTRLRFPGRKAIIVVLLAVQMIPGAAILIPLFLTFRDLGLLNSFLGLCLAYTATVLPFGIVVLRGFFQAIPLELEEAARLDGAGETRLLRSIYFPLVLPGVISCSVFAFIAAWNDYIVAYVMLQEQAKYTLPVWLVSFSTNVGTDYGGIVAGSVLFAIPVVVFFMILQRKLVSGMSAGAVKG